MATAIVSGRVDEAVKERAGAYIHAAGLTVGDVINRLWEYIAATGDTTEFLEKTQTEQPPAFERFLQLRNELAAISGGAVIPEMSNDELKDYLASERLKDYEAL